MPEIEGVISPTLVGNGGERIAGPAHRVRLSPRIFLVGLYSLDVSMLLFAVVLVVSLICTQQSALQPLQRASALALLSAAILTAAALRTCGAYRTVALRWTTQARCVAIAVCVGAAGLLIIIKFIAPDVSQGEVISSGWLVGSGSLLCLARVFTVPLANHLRAEGRLMHRVAIFGTSQQARTFIHQIRRNASDSVELVGIYEDRCYPIRDNNLLFCGGLHEIAVAVRCATIDAVVFGGPVAGQEADLRRLCESIEGCAVDVFRLYDPLAGADLPISYVAGMPVAVIARRPLTEWQALQKSVFDRIAAMSLLVLLSPVLALIALLVRLDSVGPALFRQPRIGLNNNLFECFKFRTMRHDVRDMLADLQTTRNDPRVTRLGYWLRRLSLDELPQLLNVLRGEMSLVGPRPHAPNTRAEGQMFADLLPGYAHRHRIKPGITGWAQVNGWRGQTATAYHLEQRIRHDVYYIENWSLCFDLYILFLTVFRGFVGPQAF